MDKNRWQMMSEIKEGPPPGDRNVDPGPSENELAVRALRYLVDNRLARTPVRHGFCHFEKWYAENRTIRLSMGEGNGMYLAARELAQEKSFMPMFLSPGNLKRAMERIKLECPDWIVLDGCEVSDEFLAEIYRAGAPGLQLVLIFS